MTATAPITIVVPCALGQLSPTQLLPTPLLHTLNHLQQHCPHLPILALEYGGRPMAESHKRTIVQRVALLAEYRWETAIQDFAQRSQNTEAIQALSLTGALTWLSAILHEEERKKTTLTTDAMRYVFVMPGMRPTKTMLEAIDNERICLPPPVRSTSPVARAYNFGMQLQLDFWSCPAPLLGTLSQALQKALHFTYAHAEQGLPLGTSLYKYLDSQHLLYTKNLLQ